MIWRHLRAIIALAVGVSACTASSGARETSTPLSAAASAPADAPRTEIRFDVHGSVRGGTVVVALYADEATFLKEGRAVKTARAIAAAPSTVVIFEDVAVGHYAAAAYQDENADGTLNRSLVGYPSEPFGFSNAGTVGVFGPPSFDDCAFAAERATTEQKITLR